MAYEPTVWECGDVVTADALNNIEEGIQEALDCCGEVMVVTLYYDTDLGEWQADKTATEILNAWNSGIAVVGRVTSDGTEYTPATLLTATSNGVGFETVNLHSNGGVITRIGKHAYLIKFNGTVLYSQSEKSF